MQFDSTRDLGFTLPSPVGDIRVSVSYPSDADLSEWRRKKRLVQQDLGRRSFQWKQSEPEQADLDLLKKILKDPEDGGLLPAFLRFDQEQDEESVQEAMALGSHIADKIAECEGLERPEREGNAYAIKLLVQGHIDTVHVLRIPFIREQLKYERSRVDIRSGQYGRQETRVNYQAGADLYDKVLVRNEGYAPGSRVPIVHKAQAVNVLMQEIQSAQDGESADDELGRGAKTTPTTD